MLPVKLYCSEGEKKKKNEVLLNNSIDSGMRKNFNKKSEIIFMNDMPIYFKPLKIELFYFIIKTCFYSNRIISTTF